MSAADILLYRNELGQTLRQLIAERIRAEGIHWNRDHPEVFDWRDKPYMDGVRVDLDEDDQVEYLVAGVMEVLRKAAGDWPAVVDAYFRNELGGAHP